MAHAEGQFEIKGEGSVEASSPRGMIPTEGCGSLPSSARGVRGFRPGSPSKSAPSSIGIARESGSIRPPARAKDLP